MHRLYAKRRRSSGGGTGAVGAQAQDPREAAHDKMGNRGFLRLMRKRYTAAAASPAQREHHAEAAAQRAMTHAPSGALDTARGGRLSGTTQRWLERSFGADLSGLRIHAGADAASRARHQRAAAFAEGDDLYFAAGRYAPNTRQGQRLLAHEVAHAVEQRAIGQRTIQRQPEEPGEQAPIAANEIFPFEKGTKLVQASTTTEVRLGMIQALADLAHETTNPFNGQPLMSDAQHQNVMRGLAQIRAFAPVGQQFDLVVTESSPDVVLAEQDPKTVVEGAVARRLELRRIEGNQLVMRTQSNAFNVTPEKQPDGGWRLASTMENQAVMFVISAPDARGARRVHVVTQGQEIDLVEVTPRTEQESPEEVAKGSFQAAADRAEAALPHPTTISGGFGYGQPTSVRAEGWPLFLFSMRKRFLPFDPDERLTFPVGFDMATFMTPDDFAFLLSLRHGVELSPQPGTYFNLQTGLTFGTLPELPTPDDPTLAPRMVLGADVLFGAGQVFGPVRSDFLFGWTGGLTDLSPSFMTMFLMLGGRLK